MCLRKGRYALGRPERNPCGPAEREPRTQLRSGEHLPSGMDSKNGPGVLQSPLITAVFIINWHSVFNV